LLRLVLQLDPLKKIGGSALTDERMRVPEAEPSAPVSGNSIPVTYVPFRNAHFLAVAVSWAEVIGANAIFIGAVAEDSSGYPDCRPEYYRVFEELARVGTRPETQITIVTPVIGMRKSEIVRQAFGVCDSFLLRLQAFADAGVPYPIPYRVRVAR
jgi:7-cyano-7-deazaguanine synthase